MLETPGLQVFTGITNHWTGLDWTGLDWTGLDSLNKLLNHRGKI